MSLPARPPMPDSGSRRALTAAFLSLIPICAASPGAGQEWHDFRSARQVGDVEGLDVHLLYAGGTLQVSPAEPALLYDARLLYDAARSAPDRNWRRDGDTGRLRFGTTLLPERRDEVEAAARLDEWDLEFDLADLDRGLDQGGRLAFSVNPSVPTTLRVGVGAGRARLELGGMTLTAFEFLTGAGDVRLGFARENRVPMELLSMKSGATGFVAENLGNARFERLEFDGVVGDVVLDFSGAWRSSAEAEVRMALGELVMRVPSEIGVRVRRRGLASLAAEDFRQVGDAYLSPNWESARVRLEITLVAGLGSVTVERG
ncbi:hypothetical protein [Candidatus Palauibacter sp.]|uniref:hypothetical protein n=2 Tax=Candidatus Palauibacter sp. TaxID=3101350 RepID=UPI003B528315